MTLGIAIAVLCCALFYLLGIVQGIAVGTRRFNRRPPGKHTAVALAAAEEPPEPSGELEVVLATAPAADDPWTPSQPWEAPREYPASPTPSVYARNLDPTRTVRDALGAPA